MMTPLEIAIKLESLLKREGVSFDRDGFPIIDPCLVIRELPDELELHTIDRLAEASNPGRTIGVSFMPDDLVYRRLERLEEDTSRYKHLLAIGGFDLSPRIAMSRELQQINLLINQMATLYVALSGVPAVPNFRTGCVSTVGTLACWPKGSIFVVGALGCARGNLEHNIAMLRTKLLIAEPSELLIYGTLRQEYRRVLEEQGIHYRVFRDRRSKGYEIAKLRRRLHGR